MKSHSEMFAESMLMLHANMTCGDCVHFSHTGCREAAESLVLSGYPFAVVDVREYMSAETCPSFERSDKSKTGDDNSGWSWENGVDAAYAERVGK